MAIFEVSVWIVSKGRDKEHEKLMKRFIRYEKANSDKFKEQKSFRYFRGWAGEPCPVGGRVCLWEFESLADMEKMYDRLRKDEEFKKMDEEWLNLVDANSVRRYIWRDMNRNIWE